MGCSKPATIRNVVVLPQPLGPSMVKNSPVRDVELHLANGDELAEVLADPVEANGRVPGASRRLRARGTTALAAPVQSPLLLTLLRACRSAVLSMRPTGRLTAQANQRMPGLSARKGQNPQNGKSGVVRFVQEPGSIFEPNPRCAIEHSAGYR